MAFSLPGVVARAYDFPVSRREGGVKMQPFAHNNVS